jgi:hypothetical protein
MGTRWTGIAPSENFSRTFAGFVVPSGAIIMNGYLHVGIGAGCQVPAPRAANETGSQAR